MGVIPGEPTDVEVTEATKSYVVLAWKPPVQRGHEGVMYYIEKVRRNGLLPHVELKCISTRFDIQLMVKSSVCFAKMPLIHCSQLLKCEYFLIFSGFCVVDHPKQKKCYVNVCLRSSCQIYLTIVLLAALSVTCAWFSVDHSVFQVQTPGRG